MKTIEEVVTAFEIAALNAGLARNTVKTYAPVISEFSRMMKGGEIRGVQDYLDHLAGMKSVQSPLDSEARRNITPIRKTA